MFTLPLGEMSLLAHLVGVSLLDCASHVNFEQNIDKKAMKTIFTPICIL